MSYSHFHFFGSSWQAGCPPSLVPDTVITFKLLAKIIFKRIKTYFVRNTIFIFQILVERSVISKYEQILQFFSDKLKEDG
jgi:hypothetical protein